MNKSDILIESKTMRDSVADRTDVLDKVKKLKLLPDDINLTIEMAANYYEVGIEAIHSNFKDYRKEFESDGLKILKGEELKKFVMSHKDMANYVSKKTRSLSIFPKRALLRLGMFLKESRVAQSVRDSLLDNEQQNKPQNIIQIPTELNLLGQISDAIQQSFKAMVSIQNELTETKKEVQEAKEETKQLKEEIDDVRSGLVDVNLPLRTQFNDAVRKYARRHELEFDDAYNNVYSTLGKQNHVDLKKRLQNRQEKGEKVKMIDIVEELNLLVPAIRLAKTLAGIAS